VFADITRMQKLIESAWSDN